MNDDQFGTFGIMELPVYVGHWHMQHGEIKIYTTTKPSLCTRFWFSFFFGIEWYEG